MEVLQDEIRTAGALVTQLKASNEDHSEALTKLLALKEKYAVMVAELESKKAKVEKLRHGVESLCLRKFFYVPSFEIYGATAGLFDFGPPGCAVKENIIAAWRNHFVLTERMLEVSCTCVTPRPVLKASGHVDRFSDFMVSDENNEYHRADKLLEEHVDKILEDTTNPVDENTRMELIGHRAKADAYSKEELTAVLKELKVTSPDGKAISDPFPFNLMFTTSIGPSGKSVGFMRPETAQGIFVNFKRLLEYNKTKMPFAAAQIGLAFRNEIAPRSGVLRVREFPMAEIEHFVHPDDKDHVKFHQVKDIMMTLFPMDHQTSAQDTIEMTIGEAVEKKIVDNQSLGYFLARTHLFMLHIGIKREKMRFRQHLKNEMAHYSTDCWDCEIHTTYGWIECVGHADRGAFDLTAHADATGKDMLARLDYKEPKIVQTPTFTLNSKIIGKVFRQAQKPLKKYLLEEIKLEAAESLMQKLNTDGECTIRVTDVDFKITKEMVTKYEVIDKTVQSEKYLPNVIEPSFGIGRILYCVLEHAFCTRVKEDGKTTEDYLAFTNVIAPHKIAICVLSPKPQLDIFIDTLSADAVKFNLPYDVDNSSVSIGKKYARADEIGTPYAMCIDFDTPDDKQVTIRERDSTRQIRVNADIAVSLVHAIMEEKATFEEYLQTYPEFHRPE